MTTRTPKMIKAIKISFPEEVGIKGTVP